VLGGLDRAGSGVLGGVGSLAGRLLRFGGRFLGCLDGGGAGLPGAIGRLGGRFPGVLSAFFGSGSGVLGGVGSLVRSFLRGVRGLFGGLFNLFLNGRGGSDSFFLLAAGGHG